MTAKVPQTAADDDRTRIIERRDGFYWQDTEDGEQYGPFATLAEAIADMESAAEDEDAGEPLEEAEDEIGIANWIDPETGQPAEEFVPRLEDH